MLPTKFRINWLTSFKEEDLQKSTNLKKRMACGGHVYYRIGTKSAIFIEDILQMLPTKCQFIWESDFRGEDFQKSTNQKQEWPVAAMFVNVSGLNEQY